MTDAHDDRVDGYLWDPAAPPAPEVAAVEARLEALRFEPAPQARLSGAPTCRLGHEGGPGSAWLRPRRCVLVAGAGYWTWRFSWPAGRSWAILAGPPAAPSELAVGVPLHIAGDGRADIGIARIGRMSITGDTRLTLQSTQGSRHRLTLDAGSVHVRVWAPPGSVVFRTPAGEVIDLGCEFDLTATADLTVVHVRSGWVQIENGIDETLIPAGATGESRIGRAPTVAVFDDATPAFAAAVRALEGTSVDRAADVATIVADARARDVYTLLMLVERGTPGRRGAGRARGRAGAAAERRHRERHPAWRSRQPLAVARHAAAASREELAAKLARRVPVPNRQRTALTIAPPARPS